MVEKEDWRIVYLKEEDILKSSGLVDAIKNSWFSIDPEKGLLFWQPEGKRKGKLLGASPQCNRDKDVAKMLQEKLYPWAELKFFPVVLIPINVSDYSN